MRNLSRISNYWNRVEAWNDWNKLADQARKAGRADLVEKYQPAESAGWRKVDASIEKLRTALQAADDKNGTLTQAGG